MFDKWSRSYRAKNTQPKMAVVPESNRFSKICVRLSHIISIHNNWFILHARNENENESVPVEMLKIEECSILSIILHWIEFTQLTSPTRNKHNYTPISISFWLSCCVHRCRCCYNCYCCRCWLYRFVEL